MQVLLRFPTPLWLTLLIGVKPCLVQAASAVVEDERYLVYHDFILDTPLELRLRFGPTGAFGWVKGDKLIVRGVMPQSPAEGKLLMHDLLTGAGGQPFAEGRDPRPALADAITRAETSEGHGELALSLVREGKPLAVTLQLPVMGAYADTWPFGCAKSRKVLDQACEYVARWQHPNGYCDWFWNALIFLAHPDLRYRDNARRAAYYMTDDLVEYDTTWGHPYERGLTSWRYGYKALYLAEYYLATGDASVLPALEKLTDWIARGQMKCGSWAHRSPWGGYGAVNQVGLACFMALALCREAGVKVDEAALNKATEFFGSFVGIGAVPYGDHPPYGFRENQGKCAAAAIAFRLLDKPQWSRVMASMTCLSFDTFEETHAGGMFTWFWSPLGGRHAPPEEFRTLLDRTRWFYELGRTENGAIVGQPTPENLSGRTWSGAGAQPRRSTGALALVYALPYKRLRILGRQSAPVPDPTTDVAAQVDVRLTLAAIQRNLAEDNTYLASEQLKALRRYRPDLSDLETLEAKIPTARLAAEKEAADACFPNFAIRDWLMDEDLLKFTREAAAQPDGYYSRLARRRLPTLLSPRLLGQHQWQPVAAGPARFQRGRWQNGAPVTQTALAEISWEDCDALALTDREPGAVLLRQTFHVATAPARVVALQLSAPSGSRVYLNGFPIVDLVRANPRKGAQASTVLLHPKTRRLIHLGDNELLLRVPAERPPGDLSLTAKLVSAERPEGGAA